MHVTSIKIILNASILYIWYIDFAKRKLQLYDYIFANDITVLSITNHKREYAARKNERGLQ